MAGTEVVNIPINQEACFKLSGVDGPVQAGTVKAAVSNPAFYVLVESDGLSGEDLVCVGSNVMDAETALDVSGDVDLSDGVVNKSDRVLLRTVPAQATAVVLGQVTFRPRTVPLPEA